MIVTVVLGVLAGGFAYSMKVETKLAQNSGFDGDLEWLGRSGVELGRYVLLESLKIPSSGIHSTRNGPGAHGHQRSAGNHQPGEQRARTRRCSPSTSSTWKVR